MKEIAIKDLLMPGMQLFEDGLDSDILHRYPFDCSPLDLSYGGGIPAGRIVEIFAWESTGKSTLALEICKNFSLYWTLRNKPHVIVWQEVESTFDRKRSVYMEVPVGKFIIGATKTYEEMGVKVQYYCNKSLETGIKVLHIVDTTAALMTENEANPKTKKKADGGWEENKYSGGMMEKPRIFKQILKELAKPLGQTDGTLIMCNQIYKNTQPFQEDQAPGGGGPRFYCSVRTKLSVVGQEVMRLPNGEEKVIGIRTQLKHMKNKTAPAKTEVEFIIRGESGIDKFGTLFNFLLQNHFFKVSSSWKTFAIPVQFGKFDETTKDPKTGEMKYIEPVMEDVKFQNQEALKQLIEARYPFLMDWANYQVHLHFTIGSPLTKVNLINKIWDYEMKFFGKKLTELDAKEKAVAALEAKMLAQEE